MILFPYYHQGNLQFKEEGNDHSVVKDRQSVRTIAMLLQTDEKETEKVALRALKCLHILRSTMFPFGLEANETKAQKKNQKNRTQLYSDETFNMSSSLRPVLEWVHHVVCRRCVLGLWLRETR